MNKLIERNRSKLLTISVSSQDIKKMWSLAKATDSWCHRDSAVVPHSSADKLNSYFDSGKRYFV